MLVVQRNMESLEKRIEFFEKKIDTLNNEIDTLEKTKVLDRSRSLRFYALTNFSDLKDINFTISPDSKKPPIINILWNKGTASKPYFKKRREKQLKDFVLDLMEIDSIIFADLREPE